MGSFLGVPEVAQKSQWRMDFEQYLREEARKPRPIIRAAQIRTRQAKAVADPNKPKAPRKPRTPKTARRKGIRNERRQHDWLVVRSKFCGVCQVPLNANNSSGYCKAHWAYMLRVHALGERPTCTFDGCNRKLYRDNLIGLCREHGDPVRRRAWEEANKEKSIERKRAWNKANPDRRKKTRKDMVKSDLRHAEQD